MTRYVAVTDEARDRKMLITSWHLLPDIAVADPALTYDLLPPRYRVSGVDALTHAVEAYVSHRAQPLSDLFALAAIRRIGGALLPAYRNPRDGAARAANVRWPPSRRGSPSATPRSPSSTAWRVPWGPTSAFRTAWPMPSFLPRLRLHRPGGA